MAARTVAGVLTLVIIAVPTLIYAGASGVLTFDRLAPILIGVAACLLLVVVYVLSLGLINRVERRRVAVARAAFEATSSDPMLTRPELRAYAAQQAEDVARAGKFAFRSKVAVTLIVPPLFAGAALLADFIFSPVVAALLR
ncbi:hypothetical protein C5E16_10995 [Clavibacter michiganensis]|uniref:Uncharacterized protein n=1 Tax=Clavibacter michiganensis TaxID=28447 RepID=A0A2S5VSM1_9MICO|nr:hypothetical protein C5E16_10995 [Clavibacter michiganensis]